MCLLLYICPKNKEILNILIRRSGIEIIYHGN